MEEDVEDGWGWSGDDCEGWGDGESAEESEEEEESARTKQLRDLRQQLQFWSRYLARRMRGETRDEDSGADSLVLLSGGAAECEDDLAVAKFRRISFAEFWTLRVPSSLPDELHSQPLQLKSQLSLFHHLFRCPTEEWEEYQYRIRSNWNELEAQRLAQETSRATRRKRGKKGKRVKSKINNAVVCQIPNSTSCAHVEHRDHSGNDKAHVELRSLESLLKRVILVLMSTLLL